MGLNRTAHFWENVVIFRSRVGGVSAMPAENHNVERALEGVDEGKRATLARLITGTSFVVPVVASFAMGGLTISKHAAAATNSTVILSDRRLKSDIVRLATLPSGLGLYRFHYRGGDVAYV